LWYCGRGRGIFKGLTMKLWYCGRGRFKGLPMKLWYCGWGCGRCRGSANTARRVPGYICKVSYKYELNEFKKIPFNRNFK